jgi:hypothetical protein
MARFAKSLEGIDDPAGDYMFSLQKRVARLERAVEHLETKYICPMGAAYSDRSGSMEKMEMEGGVGGPFNPIGVSPSRSARAFASTASNSDQLAWP